MAIGLKLFDESGVTLLDTTRRTFRVLTVQALSAALNGSYSSGQLATGDPIIGVATKQTTKMTPAYSVNGTTVSWDWGSTTVDQRATDAHIMIAVF